jgi:hypothetical protein
MRKGRATGIKAFGRNSHCWRRSRVRGCAGCKPGARGAGLSSRPVRELARRPFWVDRRSIGRTPVAITFIALRRFRRQPRTLHSRLRLPRLGRQCPCLVRSRPCGRTKPAGHGPINRPRMRRSPSCGASSTTAILIAPSRFWLADDCLGKPKPEIVGFGSSAGFDRDYCRHHPRQKMCLISHGR